MPFLALLMTALGHCRGCDALALREQNRLILFDLDDIRATGLMNVGHGSGIAVLRIQRHWLRLPLCVLSQGPYHRNFTGVAALHRRVGQESAGTVTDREYHRWLVPRGKRASQHLPIYGRPVVSRMPLYLHANVLVDQRVPPCPVHACQESR